MSAVVQAAAQADLQHLVSARRMRRIDAMTPEQRRQEVWGDDYDAGERQRKLYIRVRGKPNLDVKST